MNLSEAWDCEVTREDARAEILKHDASFTDFLAEIGDKPFYVGEEVLAWLGY
jgi:hypothetical protein